MATITDLLWLAAFTVKWYGLNPVLVPDLDLCLFVYFYYYFHLHYISVRMAMQFEGYLRQLTNNLDAS